MLSSPPPGGKCSGQQARSHSERRSFGKGARGAAIPSGLHRAQHGTWLRARGGAGGALRRCHAKSRSASQVLGAALGDASAGVPPCMRDRGMLRGGCWHPSSRRGACRSALEKRSCCASRLRRYSMPSAEQARKCSQGRRASPSRVHRRHGPSWGAAAMQACCRGSRITSSCPSASHAHACASFPDGKRHAC